MRSFLLVCLAVVSFQPATLAQPPAAKPKLAVLIVFDQMRGDYIERWQELFGQGGFRRLQTDGAWFANCHYPYAMTATGPGHASLLTGCSGDRHGIVANNWYDRKEAASVYCASFPRYERVPPAPKVDPPTAEEKKADEEEKKAEEEEKKNAGTADEKSPSGFGAPVRLLAPTLGDVIKEATKGQGKVFGLSLKDRSALLPAGRKPDGCYWFDKGQFVTSTYYGGTLHPWVAKFNDEKFADQWFGKRWERLRPDLEYAKLAGPDDAEGEGKGAGQGRVFPHAMGDRKKVGTRYYSALANSPFGNELLLELARRAIVAEKLGQRDTTDLLTISFSSNDLIGHCWGPDSQEVLDVTLRSDLIVRDLLACLDRQVGRENYILAMSADHGVCPLPETSLQSGKKAARIIPLGLLTAAQQHLSDVFVNGADGKLRWIETANEGGIYLNRRLVESRGVMTSAVAAELARWLADRPGILAAYTAAQLQGELDRYDALGLRVQKSFQPDRSGDVVIVSKPYTFVSTAKTGTTHGTPHAYDTHVPLLVYGTNIRAGRREDLVTPQAIAAILARSIGLPPPAKAVAPVPRGLFREP